MMRLTQIASLGSAVVSLLTAGCAPNDDEKTTGDASTAAGTAAAETGNGESSSPTGDGSSGGAAGGTVTLSFGVSNGVRMGPSLVDPLMGSIYGDLYLTSEVTITGPTDDAVAVASITVNDVDLSTLDVAAATWTSEPIPTGTYTFLGMYDLDANFEQSDNGPDAGDPVTLPTQSFEIVQGQDTTFTVMFDLVFG